MIKMGYEKEELKESAASVAWWLSPENSEARRELRERNEALAMWLDMIEKRVAEKLAQVEQEGEMKV